MSHPTVTPRTYSVVFVSLLGLTALTVYLSEAPLGAWHVPVALAIAGAKALLVRALFMHLLHSPRMFWLAFGAGVLFLGILMGGTLADYWTRDYSPDSRWLPETGVPPPRPEKARR